MLEISPVQPLLTVRVQSQRLDILGPIRPVCLPIAGSRCHSSSVIPFICSAEVTRVVTLVSNWKIVQEAWFGRGNVELKRVSRSLSDLQCHSRTLPNDRDGISVSAFSTPGMCIDVSGHKRLMLRRSASARTSLRRHPRFS